MGVTNYRTVSEKNHYEAQPFSSSDRLIVIHTPQVQTGVSQLVVEIPQATDVDPDPADQVVNEEHQDNVEQPIEQPVEQQIPQENDEATLRRSTRVRKSAIPSDYMVYLQEMDYNIGAENDLDTFSQAMSSKNQTCGIML